MAEQTQTGFSHQLAAGRWTLPAVDLVFRLSLFLHEGFRMVGTTQRGVVGD